MANRPRSQLVLVVVAAVVAFGIAISGQGGALPPTASRKTGDQYTTAGGVRLRENSASRMNRSGDLFPPSFDSQCLTGSIF